MVRKWEISPWTEEWTHQYEIESEALKQIFFDELLGIHHVGSTSVKSIGYAKPIIDILIIVKNIERVNLYNELMIKADYRVRGENGIHGRRYFTKGDPRTHHVHIYQHDDSNILKYLDFKEYLIAHPQEGETYGKLKLDILKSISQEEYQQEKEVRMAKMLKEALRWGESKRNQLFSLKLKQDTSLGNMNISAVLFDLDGTLLDRGNSLFHFVQDQYERCPHLQHIEKAAFVQRFIELDNHGYVWKDKVYQQLLSEFSIQGLGWKELLNDYLINFQRHCIGYPNLMNTLTQLKDNGIKIALVSNGYGQFQYDNFKALGISHLFDEVLISDWEGVRKPDPEIFVRALSKLGVSPDEAIFVGDHPENDIKASNEVGMCTVWKRNTQFSTAVDADFIIDDLDELVQWVFKQ
jgi:putative hydrolase of the HAD superfamily